MTIGGAGNTPRKYLGALALARIGQVR